MTRGRLCGRRGIAALALLAWSCCAPAGAQSADAPAAGPLGAPATRSPDAEAPPLARTILALYSSREEPALRFARVHALASMPLNHLGLKIIYWDIAQGLPDLAQLPALRGVLSWFKGTPMAAPLAYFAWAGAAVDSGLPFVVLGDTGGQRDLVGTPTPGGVINGFLARLGLRDDGDFSGLTYRARAVVKDSGMVEFERRLTGILPAYGILTRIDPRVRPLLVLRRGDDPATDSTLISLGPHGGYAASDYAQFFDPEMVRSRWRINPFQFFRAAFRTDDLPKPDATTASGRRLFFSHIDGDGWRNTTEIEAYAKRPNTTAAEVILEEVAKGFPDLPVTVAPIAADLAEDWYGTAKGRDVARRLLALPNVEAGSHTWTHPFRWSFFQDYHPADEPALAANNAAHATDRWWRRLMRGADQDEGMVGEHEDAGRYRLPRAYAKQPFSLAQEIDGAVALIGALLPPGKQVKVLQWSGDTRPFEAAVAMSRAAGLRNINGGDTRFDAEYPSYTTVAPIGIPVGGQYQVYSAFSNENTYTGLWTERFFGFKLLQQTVRATGSPLRLKPFNIYYHIYSGQKLASLNAVRANLALARRSEIAPVATSTYCAMADGFHSVRFIPLGPRRWRIEDRDGLQTLRFDHGAFLGVDFTRSHGVIGQRHAQGSLYVALDSSVAAPVVGLLDLARADREPTGPQPYLVSGRWLVSHLATDTPVGFVFRAQGFGDGEQLWQLPGPGRFAVVATDEHGERWRGTAEADADGRLAFRIESSAITGLTVRVSPAGIGPS
ncbi:MAG: hypothetical protein GC191_06755 [Azospirillum sp.]|nr:hypothetical protein [Azospirillum sp.]